ncbi:hypothetical protein [Yersinia mollaretii]|uniref:hypothetical protein n=1 Tax=Yersinia mollaretii TaxID=33060 RepID=UPI001643C596|nr:hypothetical protein [Yersinia mollaretii]
MPVRARQVGYFAANITLWQQFIPPEGEQLSLDLIFVEIGSGDWFGSDQVSVDIRSVLI